MSAGPGCSRGGPADLLSSRQERPCCPVSSWPLSVPGGGRILGCVPGALYSRACTVGFTLQPRSRLSVEPPPEPLRGAPGAMQRPLHGATSSARGPPSCSQGHAVPSMQSRLQSSSELLPGQYVPALQPFRELSALYWAHRCLLVSQGALGHPCPPGVLL